MSSIIVPTLQMRKLSLRSLAVDLPVSKEWSWDSNPRNLALAPYLLTMKSISFWDLEANVRFINNINVAFWTPSCPIRMSYSSIGSKVRHSNEVLFIGPPQATSGIEQHLRVGPLEAAASVSRT